MIKITKFGGSSVASPEQFAKVKSIIEADPSRRFVVVSAAGKRFSGDNKVTDLLYLVNAHRDYHVDCSALLDDIEGRFTAIKETLGLSWPVAEKFREFREGLADDSPEYVVSRGEWFTAHLMAEYLGLPFVDAADAIVFHHDGTLDLERTADPRVVEGPRTIERITFDEMRELSYMGASVLHEEAIFPVREANIPIAILNTNAPESGGTIIRERVENRPEDPVITGIAGRRDFMSVYIGKTHMSDSVGFLRRVLSIFERYGVSVEHIPTGIDSFSVVVNGADVKDSIYSIVADIQKELEPDEVKVVDKLALVSVVGRNMSSRPGSAGKLLGVLGNAGINVRMITQSSQEINIIIGVSNEDFERTVRVVYEAFVKDEGE